MEEQKKPELTICSVCHSEATLKLLELNWDLTKKLNLKTNFIWIIADNTPTGDLKSKVDSSKFEVVPGVKITELLKVIGIFMPPPPIAIGSYHHSFAVNASLKHVKTRFMVTLDNDFFIVQPNWIEEILNNMKEKDLAFFGTPWHPRWWKKVRYFPAHFSLFVDLNKIDINTLDFRPQYDEQSFKLMQTLKGRQLIGMSKDTSYAIHDRYHNDKNIKSECIQPVFKPYKEKNILKKIIKKIIIFVTPDRLLYVPKKKDYFTDKDFAERGYFDIYGRGWEEYVWRDQPFSFHLRGARTATGVQAMSFEEKVSILKDAINSFIQKAIYYFE